jgi:hypothetical protein
LLLTGPTQTIVSMAQMTQPATAIAATQQIPTMRNILCMETF